MNNADIVANLEIIDFTRLQPNLKSLHDRSMRLLQEEAVEVAKAEAKIQEDKHKAHLAAEEKKAAEDKAKLDREKAAAAPRPVFAAAPIGEPAHG